MEKIGIICEYNPFHNGHIYHIKKIKEKYKDSIIILASSGYFTQRGDISILSKYDKVKLALKNMVDIIIEIPTIYTLNSSDTFANISIKALNEAGCERIIFGSETNNIDYLTNIANKFNQDNINKEIKKYLDKGYNYPTSLSKALKVKLDSNDILAVSYIKAINNINKNIKPNSIKRTSTYNDLEENNKIISANNIRYRFYNNENIDKFIPNYDDIKLVKPNINKAFELIKYRIITDKDLNTYLGVDEGIENRLKKVILKSNTLDELIENTKSKRYTKSRIKRMLIHILLGIKKEDININNNKYRIIGLSNKGRKYIKENKPSNLVFKYEGRIREIEINTSIIYDELTNKSEYKKEISNKPILY